VHIHSKVHLDKQTLLTTQLFTNRAFDEKVYAAKPYAEDGGRDVYNDADGIYDRSLELTLSQEGDEMLGVMTFDVRRASAQPATSRRANSRNAHSTAGTA